MKMNLTFATLLAASIAFAGCAKNQRQLVIAATGTSVGLEVAQSPINQSPQMKFGYQRAEIALVPTNRNGGEASSGSFGEGAPDAPDVLMELWYRNLLQDEGGIYQRLAVGPNAVRQPGAAFLFARQPDGRISDTTAAAVQNALSAIPTAKVEAIQQIGQIREKYMAFGEDRTRKDKANAIVKELSAVRTDGGIKYENYRQLVLEGSGERNMDLLQKILEEISKL